jgi:putative PEP-CTERM system histidine kinase
LIFELWFPFKQEHPLVMQAIPILAFASAIAAGAVAVAVACRPRRSVAHWAFVFGMLALAARNSFYGLTLNSTEAGDVVIWENWTLTALSFVPGIWLLFSLTYARGNYREFLRKWNVALACAFAAPIFVAVALPGDTIVSIGHPEQNEEWQVRLGIPGLVLMLLVLLGSVLVLMNLERTFRASVGTMRWRIKFMIIGLGVIFGAEVYTASQVLLFRATDLSLPVVNSVALLVGCALILRSLLREGHFNTDVYPSQSILQNSLTVFLAGIYLLIIGVFAKIVAFLGGDASFTVKAFIVLVALVLLSLILLSDRVRLRTRRFVSRHFQRPFYDYRSVWWKFTQGTARRVERDDLCAETVKLVSEIFQALSVTIWLVGDSRDKLSLAASTSFAAGRTERLELNSMETSGVLDALVAHPEPVDLDASKEEWVKALGRLQPDEFHKGGNRACVPLMAGGELLGLMTLGDRVSGLAFSIQDFDLLKSIGGQIAANLLNIKLSHRVLQAKQLEAFQAMSTFFVHDLKNTASTLSLMLQNLPTHFNDPRFREDALRGISRTVTHINELIGRLSLIRREMTIEPVESDLNESVSEALKRLPEAESVELARDLRPLPKLRLDPAQIQNVVTNLVLNAKDAVGSGGQIRVETARQNGWAVLTVADNGCGMNPEFVQRSLFRPFQTTKKQGIGIGMFQCKMIVEAHHGRIEVHSELAKGTTFRILLPIQPETK